MGRGEKKEFSLNKEIRGCMYIQLPRSLMSSSSFPLILLHSPVRCCSFPNAHIQRENREMVFIGEEAVVREKSKNCTELQITIILQHLLWCWWKDRGGSESLYLVADNVIGNLNNNSTREVRNSFALYGEIIISICSSCSGRRNETRRKEKAFSVRLLLQFFLE